MDDKRIARIRERYAALDADLSRLGSIGDQEKLSAIMVELMNAAKTVPDLLAALDAAWAENQRLDELWMRYGLALRHILDLVALRAHKKIEQYVKDILGTSDDLALLPVEQERDAARADVARLREALRAVAIGENLDEDEASPDRYCWCPFGWQGDDVPYCLQARAALAATEAQP